MERDRLYRTNAVVIRRSDFGEADKILTLYTPQLGKIRVLAKGVRRPVSKLGGHVELLTHSKMLLAKGRNLDIVTQSETIDSFVNIRADLNRICRGYYVAELLDRFTEDGIENFPAYKLLLETLQRLGDDPDPDLVVRSYEIKLLGCMGYRPQLQRCLRCDQELPPTDHFFSPSLGGVVCRECGRATSDSRELSLSAFKILRLLQRGEYATCSRLKLGQGVRDEVERTTLSYINCLLQREINSAEFIQTVRDQARACSG
jgi:DNA repair protein RecO (recombination protein O)